MSRILIIAQNTFLEAVRQKFFYFLIVLAIGLLASSNSVRAFDLGRSEFRAQSELRFIFDFGYGGVFLFGSVLAIVAMAQLFFSEIENRTALTLLAKPIHRAQFLLGKFVGVAALLGVYTTIMIALLGAMLYWREGVLMMSDPDEFENGRLIAYDGLVYFGIMQWLRFCIISSMTMLIGTYSNTNLFTVVVGFMAMLISQMQYIALDHLHKMESAVLNAVVWVVAHLFPNFQLFNTGDVLVYAGVETMPTQDVFRVFLYATAYCLVFMGLSVVSFRKREI